MPDDDKVAGVDLDQYQKEKDEFQEATDALLSADPEKTDEEIMAGLDNTEADDTGEAGDATNNQADEADDKSKTEPDPDPVNPDQGVVIPDTSDKQVADDTDVDWKAKAESLEAELAKERQKTSSWNGRITAANKKVKEYEERIIELNAIIAAGKTSDGSSKTTDADKDTLDKFREDFPEMGSVIDIFEKRIDAAKQGKAKATDDSLYDGPTEDEIKTDDGAPDQTDHIKTIREVHPDLDEAVSSGVLLTWINQQPDFIRSTLQTIYKKGSSDQVIKMVTEFKAKSGWKSQLDKTTDAAGKKAKDKLDAMREVNSDSGGAPTDGPDKNDFEGAAKEAFG